MLVPNYHKRHVDVLITWNTSDTVLDMNALWRVALATFGQITFELCCAVLVSIDLRASHVSVQLPVIRLFPPTI